MKRKVVLLAFVSAFLSTTLFLCFAGLLGLQVAYASPYTNINVGTAYNMITNGSFPDLVVLDVRSKSEYDGGHIYGAVWIPHTEVEARIDELAGHENHEIIVYCGSGVRSATASGILESHNFTKVYNMMGGMSAWQFAGYPVWIATVHNINTTYNYDTIQAAIDAPQTLDGHTILVDAGIYYEHNTISKSISLIGEDRSTTNINGNGTGYVVHVTVDNISVSNFTIQGSGCGCMYYSGLFLENSHNSKVTNNVVINNGYGIYLYESSNSTISGNHITNNTNYSIAIRYSSSNTTVSGNNITNNEGAIHLLDSSNNTISGNNIDNHWDGIFLDNSSYNNIVGNNIANNDYGIYIDESSNSTIYHNNFVDNTEQVYSSNSTNVWDNCYPSGGNFWSNYNGTDFYSGFYQNETGSDGVGDTPHIIDENNIDRYPLVLWLLGDVNGDGKVTTTDVTIQNSLLTKIMLELITMEEALTERHFADLNYDGKITTTDVTINNSILTKIMMGLE